MGRLVPGALDSRPDGAIEQVGAPAGGKTRAYSGSMGAAFFDGALSPTPRYYEVQGRAAEIARAMGSPIGGPEHLFLGMLHDGGWPVSVISDLVDLGEAEAAVLSIFNGPGYSPPPRPRFVVRDSFVWMWGADVAFELGDPHLGLEHALLAMIRLRETIPARALAPVADLDALEAVLAARNASAAGPPGDAVYLPDGQEMDDPLSRAIADALPEETTFGFNSTGGERTWVRIIGRGDRPGAAATREVLNAALTSLGRPTLPD